MDYRQFGWRDHGEEKNVICAKSSLTILVPNWLEQRLSSQLVGQLLVFFLAGAASTGWVIWRENALFYPFTVVSEMYIFCLGCLDGSQWQRIEFVYLSAHGSMLPGESWS